MIFACQKEGPRLEGENKEAENLREDSFWNEVCRT